MALVMIVTRDVADRFHGFLASLMLEVAPNVFVAPRMNKSVRERTWGVVSSWYLSEAKGSLVMVWRDLNEVGGIGLAHLGTPSRELVEMDGMWLTRRSKSANVL
jgi:CRISPR-associated protein Cas2